MEKKNFIDFKCFTGSRSNKELSYNLSYKRNKLQLGGIRMVCLNKISSILYFFSCDLTFKIAFSNVTAVRVFLLYDEMHIV